VTSARRLRRPSLSLVREAIGVVAAYAVVAVYVTWPLARHPLGGFYGFGNDNWGGIPLYGWLHDAYLGPGNPSFDPAFQAPFGLDLPQQAIQPLDRLFSLLFGGFGQGLGAYNAQIFSSFVLAGCTMYLFARYLTGSRLAAFVAGFIFTFSPFHLAVSMQYNALASIEWIPLYLLALMVFLRRQGAQDAVLAGAAFALVVVTSYYYAWLIGWFTLLVLSYFALSRGFRSLKTGRPIGSTARRYAVLGATRVGLAGLTALVLAGPLLLTSARGTAELGAEAVGHPITEAVRYSARPWMFFVPPHDNPVAGDRVTPWITMHLYDSPVYEQAIYLGYTALLLSLVALWRTRRGSSLPERWRLGRELLLIGGLAGALIMMGPYLPLDKDYWRLWATPGATTHLPSLGWLMYELTPVFRFFVRAYVLVSACLAGLAAIGFARLERGRGMTLPRRATLCALVIGLTGLEYTNSPPHVWFSKEPTPAWVSAVHNLPAKSEVVDYPLAPSNSPRSLYYMFWQTVHGRRTQNPWQTTQAQALAAEIGDPTDPASGEALHRAGIDYAVVHTRLPPQTTPPYQPALPDDSMPRDAGAINPWFEPVARTPDAVLYRIRSRPTEAANAVGHLAAGFGGPELEGEHTARWLEERTGTITLDLGGRRRPLHLVLTLSSFDKPRHIRVSLDGHPLASFDVVPGVYTTKALALGALASGRHLVTLTPNPGPQSIAATTGLPDSREVSLRIREPVVVSH
jgi:hypothetical protein